MILPSQKRLEGIVGAGNTNATCCGGGNLPCVHHVVFVSAVPSKCRWHGAVKEKDVAYMIYYIITVKTFSLYFTSFRPVPTAWCSLMLSHSSSTSHSLPGARPLDPLVHMFHPSSGTHASSQCWYTCFIFWHSTRWCLAVPWCRGHAPCISTHV